MALHAQWGSPLLRPAKHPELSALAPALALLPCCLLGLGVSVHSADLYSVSNLTPPTAARAKVTNCPKLPYNRHTGAADTPRCSLAPPKPNALERQQGVVCGSRLLAPLLGFLASALAAGFARRPFDNQWAMATVALAEPDVASSPSAPSIARLRVANLHCELEARVVNDTLATMEGVRKVMINAISKLVIVQYDAHCVTCMGLVDALNRHNLGCTIQDNGEELEARGLRWSTVLAAAYYVLQVGFMLGIAYLHLVPNHRHLVSAQRAMWAYLAFGSPPILRKAIEGLRNRRPDLGLLILMAMGSAIALNDLLDAVLVVFLFSLSSAFEAACMAHIRRSLEGLHGQQPRVAVLAGPAKNGPVLPIDQVPVGALIQVRAGERVPLDGVVDTGAAAVDESAVTGESIPLGKGPGDAVYGGSLVQNGFLTVRTTGVFASSTLSQIQAAVQQAQAQASPTALLVDRFAAVYSPLVIGLAGLAMLLPHALGLGAAAAAAWLHTGLLILVLACPCSMVLSTPIATVCAIAAAARAQILIKAGGLALDRLARLHVLAMDKTGTLTQGHFQVTDVHICAHGDDDSPDQCDDGHDEGHNDHAHGHGHQPLHHHHRSPDHDEGGDHHHDQRSERELAILRDVAAVQSASTHPIAAAVLAFAVGQGSDGCLVKAAAAGYNLPPVGGVVLHEGRGISGLVEGRQVLIGNRDLMAAQDVQTSSDAAQAKANRWLQEAKTVVFVAIDGSLEMVLALSDSLKPEARQTVSQLRRDGVTIALLTGDTQESAAALAHGAGIASFRGRMTPDAKVTYIQGEKLAGNVVGMVGDGINDGPALASADIGIAMGAGGTALAAEAADVVLMSDRLSLIPAVRQLAKRCQRVVVTNLVLSVGIKLGTLITALLIPLPVWTAILTDAAALGLVIANGMTLLRPLPVEPA